ncbi:U5 small nuclear ribonucleoprotein [Saguinus oedipus]|uniref:U5 small nuclear ribonucleoprotein n=1 Tax=Saguinus oedipus TaxID=9490 RepID=A0ABQ9U0F9_SAGOE|nr:U5 small nuclear ribonucleoprotein [Saguinus oedipus]
MEKGQRDYRILCIEGWECSTEEVAQKWRQVGLKSPKHHLVATVIEQQKPKGPEWLLVPVKLQQHELLLRVVGSGPGKCSSLQAPIMLLSGHEGEVYCCKFYPDGSTLASAGFD